MSPPLVAVLWSDAHGNAFAVYESHELPHAPALVQSFGLLLKEDETGITLASEAFEAGSYRGVTFIPHGMIRSIQPYQRVRQKRHATIPHAADAQ